MFWLQFKLEEVTPQILETWFKVSLVEMKKPQDKLPDRTPTVRQPLQQQPQNEYLPSALKKFKIF